MSHSNYGTIDDDDDGGDDDEHDEYDDDDDDDGNGTIDYGGDVIVTMM